MKKKLIARLLVLAMVAAALMPVAITAVSAAYGYGAYSTKADTSVSENVVVESGSTTAVLKPKAIGGTKTAKLVLSEDVAMTLADRDEWDIEMSEGITKVEVTLPAKAMAANGKATGKPLVLNFGDGAQVTIPNEALTTLFDNDGIVKISFQNSGNNVGFSISLSGRSLTIKGLTVVF